MHRYHTADWQVAGKRFRPLLFSSALIFLTLALACSRATENPTAANNDPDQLLRKMSEKLAQAKNLSFKVDRKLDAALVEGRNVPENAQIEISVSRPGKFLAKSDSKENVRLVFFDGQNLSIFDETMKLYATVPVPGTIDEVVTKIDEKYGFTPPLAEFILSDTYRALAEQIKSKSYKGKENIAGIECHHLTLGGDVADSARRQDVRVCAAERCRKDRDGNRGTDERYRSKRDCRSAKMSGAIHNKSTRRKGPAAK